AFRGTAKPLQLPGSGAGSPGLRAARETEDGGSDRDPSPQHGTLPSVVRRVRESWRRLRGCGEESRGGGKLQTIAGAALRSGEQQRGEARPAPGKRQGRSPRFGQIPIRHLVEVRRHASARFFLDRAGPWLLRAEVENNLILGICGTLAAATPLPAPATPAVTAADAPYF